MVDNEIRLGDSVKDKYTGFKGVVVARTIFINGCIQLSVLPKYDSKSILPDPEQSIDSQSLVRTKKGERWEKETKEESTGGATRVGMKMRGF